MNFNFNSVRNYIISQNGLPNLFHEQYENFESSIFLIAFSVTHCFLF